jgi:TATA-binding protein-associated factor Taf7
MTRQQEKLLRDRLDWLKQKLEAQRAPSSQDYTTNPLLIGRTEGNIGAMEWVLRELKKLDAEET